MHQRVRVAIPTLGAIAAAAFHHSIARAEDPPRPTLRVRGVIDRDQTWSGHVLITGETMIDGATERR